MKNPERQEIRAILDRSKRIAVVGLSDNPYRTSYQISKVMLEAGYDIIPVNPTVEKVFDIPAVDSLNDIEGHIDIINVFRRSEFLKGVAEEAAQVDADVFWTQLGLVSEDAYDIAANAGMTVIMDRCIKVEHAIA